MSLLTVEECELLGDSKYRSYITQVEKALKSFENTSEWADLISALAKLNKVLLAHLKYPVIPKKVTIGKRLAQCLHPALPSGVHIKALETYDIIFKCIGTQRLAQDLFIYGAGLFPLLGHAAMSVKPVLLTIYEAHFVPLGISIKPGLNGLLLGLLPGLDEGAENFDRTIGVLEDFMDAAGASFFYTSIWECVHSCPNVRLPAVNFLLSHFNKKKSMEDQLHMIGLDIDLMVDAICNALQDMSVLVQRSTLDFLQLAFPMHNGQLTRGDIAKVVQAAINVVLRRDMSLNRRLFAWLLGTSCSGHLIASAASSAPSVAPSDAATPRLQRADSTSTCSELDTSYFHLFSRDLLVQALKFKLLDRSVDMASGRPASLILPLRMLISLLDKPEIGPVILESVLLTVFRALSRECATLKQAQDAPSGERRRSVGRTGKEALEEREKNVSEVVKTANLLFASFEPYYIWDFLARMFDVACENPQSGVSAKKPCHGAMEPDIPSVLELCGIVELLLENMPLEVYAETQTEYLPELMRHILSCLTQHCSTVTDQSTTAALKLCSAILVKVQPSLTTPSQDEQDDVTMETTSLDPSTYSFGGRIDSRMDTISQARFPGKVATEGKDINFNMTSIEDADAAGLSPVAVREKNQEQAKVTNAEGLSPVADREKKQEQPKVTDAEGLSPVAVREKKQEQAKVTDAEGPVEEKKEEKEEDDVFPSSSDDCEVAESACEEKASVKEKTSQLDAAAEKGEVSAAGKSDQDGGNGDGACQAAGSEHALSSLRMRTISGSESLRSFSNTPLPLMQACVQNFQEFFHTFLSQKVFQSSPAIVSKCLETITLAPDPFRTSDQDSVVDTGSMGSCEEAWGRQGGARLELGKVRPETLGQDGCRTFRQACRLLVDLASFPLYCTDYARLLEQSGSKEEGSVLPLWLQGLMSCCCCVDLFDIQSVAIATMLDLVILTQSVVPEELGGHGLDRGSRSAAEGRVSVVMLPALLPKHLSHINDNTVFYQVVARELWNFLGEATPGSHKRGVELFHLLHQVTPSSWICEDVIGSDLVSEELEQRIAAFKKFTVLWHLTRDLKNEPRPGQPPRSFDRSMFVVLDSLKEETGPTKTLATTWLTHVVQRSDISRVLLPLLLLLLHPDTARVSIQHVNVHTPRKVRVSEGGGEEESAEARIYAISSEGGNIIFHVSPPGPRFSSRVVEDLKSYALTVMNEKGSATTAPVKPQDDSELHFEKVNPENVKLRINPFGSTSSLDKLIFDGFELPTSSQQMPDLGNARRLDRETCKKEGLFCEGGMGEGEKEEEEEADEKTEEEKEETVESIIRALMEELVAEAVEQSEDNPVKEVMLSSPSVQDTEGGLLCDQDLFLVLETQPGDVDTTSELDTSKEGGAAEEEPSRDIHTLHMHLLLYTQQYDYRRTLYALTTLRAMLTMCPRLVVTAMTTTSISTVHSPQLTRLQALLARHRKSVFGKNFFGELPNEVLSGYRGNMFLEIIISLCLYYIRSYYPNLMMSKLSQDELLGNKEVHIVAAEVLSLLMSELVSIVRESGRNFTSYIRDLLSKCKLQKALLHCVLASVYNARSQGPSSKNTKITEAIISFNEECLPSSAVETFQVRLLNLMLIVVMLEAQMFSAQELESGANASPASTEVEPQHSSHLQSPGLSMRYLLNVPVVQQGMFLSSVLSALKQQHVCHLHRHWLAMVTSALPYMGRALPRVILNVVLQLCRNLESLSQEYQNAEKDRSGSWEHIPPDHLVTMLEGLTTIVHYCLLDNVSPVSIGQPAPTPTSISTETASAGQILSNLIHVFNPITSSRETSPQREVALMPPVLEARRELLSQLPRIMACMATLWRAITAASVTDTPADHDKHYIMGTPKVVRHHILEFVSPISRPHGPNLLAAFAVAWNDSRKKSTGSSKKLFPAPSTEQLLLVELVSAIRVLPTDTLIQTVRQVIRQPPLTDLGKGKKQVPLEVNMLQFFFSYVQQTSAAQLVDSWPSLLALMREGLQLSLSPPGQFLLLQILNEFVQKTPPMEDKKSQKDLQEITQKLLEAVAAIAGSSLEQTTWLRRNLAVKPGPQAELHDQEDGDVTEDSGQGKAERTVPAPDGEAVLEVVEPQQSKSSDSKYSVHALSLLAELTAPLLDVVYASEEKEKVAPFLTTIMYNIFPYLRNHKSHNLPSFRACSWLLAGVSSYQYTRKAWRREAFDLMVGPGFFQMDAKCLGFWRTVIDNLLTHDKTTFKDLMGRVAMTQSGSLNLFSSKEQEYEQRAQMLKRLSFAIFCSEPDQYQRSMPDIQERLAESLRLPQVPTVMAQVFFCFRVLILRMSPQHLTSLWPTIITEMVHVLLQIEQELSTETDEFNQYMRTRNRTQLQRIATLDSSWAHFGNGLNAHNNPAWLQLYLSVCKLLDQCLALPADSVPHFQLYRWAFIGTATGEEPDSEEERRRKPQPRFVPHIVRLARLLNSRMQRDAPVLKQVPGRPLLTFTYLRSLAELQPFFNTICTPRTAAKDADASTSHEKRRMPKSKSAPSFDALDRAQAGEGAAICVKSARQYMEELVEKDFLGFLSQ